MANKRISVAMCTYNGERYLREQLQSIAQQTRLPDELVICDDCSVDLTPEIVSEFSRSVPFPVRFIRNHKNLGSTKNFEQAIALCEGELIALCDQDDVWLPEKLARQAALMEHNSSLGGVFSDAEVIDERSQAIGSRLWAGIGFTPVEQRQFSAGKGAHILIKKNVVTGATFMVRADLQSIFTPIPNIWVHDGWMAWMIIVYSRLALIDVPLVRYRLHPNQQVGVKGLAPLEHLSFRERLESGKHTEPAKHLIVARELEVLDRRLRATDGTVDDKVLSELQQKIIFLKDRGSPYTNVFSQTMRLLFQLRNYRRYENGIRSLLRDIAMVLV